jgi:hypothetical protein
MLAAWSAVEGSKTHSEAVVTTAGLKKEVCFNVIGMQTDKSIINGRGY